MTNYQRPIHDFVNRTKQILSQYEHAKDNLGKPDQYEITLLLNCLLGLLVYPQQIAAKNNKDFDQWLTDEFVYNVGTDWGIDEDCILSPGSRRAKKSEKLTQEQVEDNCKENGVRYVKLDSVSQLTIRNLIRQMRNCVAHASFTVNDSSPQKDIEYIIFQDEKTNFHIKVHHTQLKIFVCKLTESLLNQLPVDA